MHSPSDKGLSGSTKRNEITSKTKILSLICKTTKIPEFLMQYVCQIQDTYRNMLARNNISKVLYQIAFSLCGSVLNVHITSEILVYGKS